LQISLAKSTGDNLNVCNWNEPQQESSKQLLH
jgi:hypothetical protein